MVMSRPPSSTVMSSEGKFFVVWFAQFELDILC